MTDEFVNMTQEEREFSLGELSEIADVSPRTVRYYIVEGLLPPPLTTGRNATYSQDHLDRLNAIAAMKEMYLPLREIRHRLNTLTPEQMRDPAYLATLSQAVAMDRSMGRRHERNPRHDRSAQIGAAAARRMAHMESPRRSMAQREQVGSLSAPPMEDVSNTWERFPLGEDAELLIRSSKAKNMGPGLYRTLHRLRHMIENDRDDNERNRS